MDTTTIDPVAFSDIGDPAGAAFPDAPNVQHNVDLSYTSFADTLGDNITAGYAKVKDTTVRAVHAVESGLSSAGHGISNVAAGVGHWTQSFLIKLIVILVLLLIIYLYFKKEIVG